MMTRLKNIWHFLLRHKWKSLIAVLVGVPLLLVIMFALSPAQPEYVTAAAQKEDLVQTVEAVGTIISERDLQLQFPTSGVVARVMVKEGDMVRQGQQLAQLRAGNMAADIASAAARLQSAEADLRAREEGARPEDIAIAEAEVASKASALASARSALEQSENKLEVLEQEAVVSLAGYVTNVGSTVTKELTSASNALGDVRDVFSKNDVVDAVIKNSITEYDQLNASLNEADQRIQSLYTSVTPPVGYQDALQLLDRARTEVQQASMLTDRAFNLISRLPATQYFTETARESYKSTLGTARTTTQTSLSTLDSAAKTLRDASANFMTRIAAEEASLERAQSDIATYEASLTIAQAQLQLKKAPTRATDLDVARAAVAQARAALQRAQADYANTVITAPIAGRITKVNVKAGEYTPSGPAITMLGDSPYRVEMYVSEIDVPKVMLTQSGSIELDAFRGTNMKLRVSEIDTAPTDRDGVSKYRVRLDFVYPHDELKIGMTGDARIITGSKDAVVTVPLRAVLENDEGKHYVRIMEDGKVEERFVTPGLEGEGGSVEVSGVEEGEVIIVLEKN